MMFLDWFCRHFDHVMQCMIDWGLPLEFQKRNQLTFDAIRFLWMGHGVLYINAGQHVWHQISSPQNLGHVWFRHFALSWVHNGVSNQIACCLVRHGRNNPQYRIQLALWTAIPPAYLCYLITSGFLLAWLFTGSNQTNAHYPLNWNR